MLSFYRHIGRVALRMEPIVSPFTLLNGIRTENSPMNCRWGRNFHLRRSDRPAAMENQSIGALTRDEWIKNAPNNYSHLIRMRLSTERAGLR